MQDPYAPTSRQAQPSFPAAASPPPLAALTLPDDWSASHWRPALAYIAALTGRTTDPENAPLCFQVFDDEKLTPENKAAGKVKTHPPVPAATLHGTFRQRLPELVRCNRAGAGIFVTINHVPAGQRRKQENIPTARAWWIDVDVNKWPPERRAAFNLDAYLAGLPLRPSITVRTKNGAHCYWLASEGVTPQDCARLNVAIATAFDGDPAAADWARVLRVPGFYHLKDPADPFLVELCQAVPFKRSVAEMDAAFPAPSKPAKATAPPPPPPPPDDDGFFADIAPHDDDSAELDRIKARARRYLAKVPPAIEGQTGSAAAFLACEHVTRGFDLELEDALEVMADWNARCQPPWDTVRDDGPDSLRRKLREARDKGTAVAIGQHLWGKEDAGRKLYVLTDDISQTTEDAIAALMEAPNLYQRAGVLVHVRQAGEPRGKTTREPAAPVISEIPTHRLLELISQRRRYIRGKKVRDPQLSIAQHVLARDNWPFRELRGVIQAPTLRHDGSLLDTPGYDHATGLLYVNDRAAFPPLPPHPTQADAIAALAVLADLIQDFPFERAAHRAAALAAILTPLVRHAFEGPAPFFIFDSTTAGAGKGLMSDVVSIIATGRACPKTVQAATDEEEEKRLMAVALAGDPLMCIDNIIKPIGSGPLDSALTKGAQTGRLLGGNRHVSVPMSTVWLGTGNNISLAGDVGRRVIMCRFAPAQERPDERTNFQIPSLLQHIREHRAELVAAGLTVVRAFILAGKPQTGVGKFGSFDGWNELVRATLVWAGAGDCKAGIDAAQHADPTVEAFRVVLQELDRWFKDSPFTLSDAVEPRDVGGLNVTRGQRDDLGDAFSQLIPHRPNGTPDLPKIAMLFRRFKGRWFGQLRVVPVCEDGRPVRGKRGQAWVVERQDGAQATLPGAGNEPAGRA